MWRYLALRKLGAVFVETILLVVCVLVAHYIRFHGYTPVLADRNQILLRAIVMAIVFQLSLHLNDIYGFSGTRPSREYAGRLCQALAMATAILCVIYFLSPALTIGRGVFIIAMLLSSGFLILWHMLLRFYLVSRPPHTNLLVLGTLPIPTCWCSEPGNLRARP